MLVFFGTILAATMLALVIAKGLAVKPAATQQATAAQRRTNGPWVWIAAIGLLLLAFLTDVHPAPLDSAQPIPRDRDRYDCPTGYSQSGSFCTPNSPSSRPSVYKPPSAQCPTGWRESAGACIKN